METAERWSYWDNMNMLKLLPFFSDSISIDLSLRLPSLVGRCLLLFCWYVQLEKRFIDQKRTIHDVLCYIVYLHSIEIPTIKEKTYKSGIVLEFRKDLNLVRTLYPGYAMLSTAKYLPTRERTLTTSLHFFLSGWVGVWGQHLVILKIQYTRTGVWYKCQVNDWTITDPRLVYGIST